MLRKGPIYDINGRFGAVGKKFSISFTKANTKFWLNVLYNNDNSYFFVNGKKSISWKLIMKMLTFQLSLL